jgi:hypothetical protein
MTNIQKEYNKQKKLFHSNPVNFGKELHHIFGRVGLFRCCRHFLIAGKKLHHEDIKWVYDLRDKMMLDKLKAEKNHFKGFCKETIFSDCDGCLVLWRGDDNNTTQKN